MSSLLPGFEYDIFVSYRQKDNKYDGWVTEFVSNLRKDLDATFKEDISIYFDENPHDGINENYDVNKSLETKLKCFILIPIISQTYCDPKSFAWQNEFCAFNSMVKKDNYGREIRLSNGNVASRILPIKIHELSDDDKLLLERELGGVSRTIDFIYKERGVNRPLKPTDNKNENQNKTDYRNQINKVANAIKEIILANPSSSKEVTPLQKEIISDSKPSPVTVFYNQRKKRFPGTITNNKGKDIFIILLLLAISWILFNYFKSYSSYNSIAVLPLVSSSDDVSEEYQIDVLTDELISSLSKVPDLEVRPVSSVLHYISAGNDVLSIANSVSAKYMLIIRTSPHAETIAISIELIESERNRVIWKKRYENGLLDITPVKEDILHGTIAALNPKLSKKEELTFEINKLYETGRYYWNKRTVDGFLKAIAYFNQILEKNPNYAPAYAGLADCYLLLTYYGSETAYVDNFVKAKEYAIKALDLDNELTEAHTSLGMILYEFDFNIPEADSEFRKAIELNPEYATAHQWYSELMASQGKFDESILLMKRAEELDPLSRIIKADFGLMYYYSGDYNRSIEQHMKALKLDPNFAAAHWWLGQTYIVQGKYEEAISSLKKALSIASENTRIVACLAYAYAISGNIQAALDIQQDLIRMTNQGGHVSPFEMALINTGIGDYDKAFSELNKAFDARPFDLVVLNVEPLMDPLRADPRFDQFIEKMKLASRVKSSE